MKRYIITVCLPVMIFGVWQFADAEEPAFSEAFYGNRSSGWISKQAGQAFSLLPLPVYGEAAPDSDGSADLMPAAAQMLHQEETSRNEWLPLKMIGPQSLFKPDDLTRRSIPDSPILGFGWDNDTGGRTRWNVVYGLGLYVSNYRDWYHASDDFDREEPVTEWDRKDLMEKIQDALQVVGFRIRYDF